MMPTVDSQYLRLAGRDLEIPFRLKVECEGRLTELACNGVLRVLPAKRLVCFGEWNGRQVVTKFFLDPVSAHRHCTREEQGLKALRDEGIRAPALLLKGTIPPDSTPVLGLERITPAQVLAEAWTRAGDEDQYKDILHRSLTVIAEQHDAGLQQKDPHLGNFLLSEGDVYTIDGDAIDVRQRGKRLSINRSLKNLGLFFAPLYPRFRHLFSEAFRHYAEKRAWPDGPELFDRFMKEVRHRHDSEKRVYFKKKIYRECSAFACRKSWNRFSVCDRDYHTESFARLLADPDHAMGKGKLLKDGNTSTLAVVHVNGLSVVVKKYNVKNIRHGLRRGFRRSRASVSWRNAHRLTSLGIKTPRPIALIEKRFGPFRKASFFISEYMEGINAYELFHTEAAREMDRTNVVRLFARLFQMLADASISHGDTKATNFIVTRDDLVLVDLDAVCEHRSRKGFLRAFMRDLERFMRNWQNLKVVENRFREEFDSLEL